MAADLEESLKLVNLLNGTILASQIAAFDLLADGGYEFGVGRGHAGRCETRSLRDPEILVSRW